VTPEQWRRVKDVFALVADWDTSKRRAWLDQNCGADPGLRTELELLLAADQAATEAEWSGSGAPGVGRADFAGNERFTLGGLLGAGGFANVYRAFDRKLERWVALKVLRRGEGEACLRFKREFRSICALHHPNLVRCFELFADRGALFFSMELVDGLPLADHLHQAGRARLAPVFEQLVHGVQALHTAGWLHRDLKPSNVLVTPQGRVVILDLGLARDVQDLAPHSTGLLGTPPYMAPERFTRETPGEATDWYSVGVMLFQVLAGRLPWSDSGPELIVDRLQRDGVPPSTFAADTPAHLDQLCVELLRRDPAQRPSGAEILRRLTQGQQRQSAATPTQGPAASAPFVGREPQLAILRAAYGESCRGHPAVVEVSGASGIGKTALIRQFLQQLRSSEEVVVLEGRCYEHESVDYKVFDGVIDALGQYLKDLPAARSETLLPRDIQALEQVFPSLQRVGAVAGARRRRFETTDGMELRRRAFDAVRELLGRIAHQQPLVVFVDDLQWGDGDSAALLRHLLWSQDAAPMLLIVAYRSELAGRPVLADLLGALGGGGLRCWKVAVEPLQPEETRQLAQLLLGLEHPRIGAVVEEAAGIPFFVGELAAREDAPPGAANLRLDEVLLARIGRLPAPMRSLLEVVSVAGKPLPRAVAREAAGLGADAEELEAVLRASHLIRPCQAGACLEPFHDRVRDVVAAALSPSRRVEIHQRLALALEGTVDPDPEDLALHHQAAGDLEHAARCAALAAGQAVSAVAFDRAARLYRMAIELHGSSDGDTRDLREKLGDALACAGRGREAAQVYLAGADGELGRSQELRRKAAEQLLRAGDVDQGLELIRGLFGTRRWIADNRAVLLTSTLLRRAHLRLRGLDYRLRGKAEVPAELLLRTDLSWAALLGLAQLDPVRASYIQSYHLLCALETGEPSRVARALALEAAFSVTAGRRQLGRHHRLATALEQMLVRSPVPECRGLAAVAKVGATFFLGRFDECRRAADAAERILLDDCPGLWWELATARAFAFTSLVATGELRECARRLPELMREAQERGDLIAQASLVFVGSCHVLRLAQDMPQLAVEELERLERQWPPGRFPVVKYSALFGLAQVALYQGDPERAWSLLSRGMSPTVRILLNQLQTSRIFYLHLRARVALSMAAHDPGQRSAFLRRALGDARALRAEREEWADGLAGLVDAAVASARGQDELAIATLAIAEADLEKGSLGLYRTIARWQRGQLLPGAGGRSLLQASEQWLLDQGVRQLAPFLRTFGPGLGPRSL